MIAQAPAPYNLSFVPGDSFSFDVEFPFDITTYEVFARIGNVDFEIEEVTDEKIKLTISAEDSAKLINGLSWSMGLILEGSERTYIKGVFYGL